MTWRRESNEPIPKPSIADRKRRRKANRLELERDERDQKAEVRRRDKRCRFPLCDCSRLSLRLEVSHETHKGMGGNPAGDRSDASTLFLLCVWRHQLGRIARGKGTLKPRYLTDKQANGPVAWMVDLESMGLFYKLRGMSDDPKWFEVAREISIGVWEPFTNAQLEILTQLRQMEI